MATRDTSALAMTGTKLRLLEAAEELFADGGFETVSVRDITTKAEANVAAVNYHFGSREDLIGAVFARYVQPMNAERVARLEALEAKYGSKAVLPLEELIDAFVRPFITQVRRSELNEKLFLKLMARMLGEREGSMPPAVEDQFWRMMERFLKAFARCLPEVPQEELLWRVHFMVGAMLHGMAHAETLYRLSSGASGTPSAEVILTRLIRFGAAGIRGGEAGSAGPAAAPATAKRGPQSEFTF